MAATNNGGRKIRPKSRVNRAHPFTVAVRLDHATPTITALVWPENPRMNWAGTYPMERRIRRSSISYTPERSASFSTRITGPSSGSTQGHPLVVASGSVAARKMAPAIRGTGVIGRPASITLTGRPRIPVSFFFLENRKTSARVEGHQGHGGRGWKT